MTPLGVQRRELHHPEFDPGDWRSVESYLGIELPTDYKDLVGDGLALILDEELIIASPFDPNEHTNLLHLASGTAWAEAVVRAEDPNAALDSVYPEAGGALCWGVDGGGACYHWDTRSDDPDRWTVLVSGRSVDGIERHDLNLTSYLDALLDGTIEAAALDGWPDPEATLERLHGL